MSFGRQVYEFLLSGSQAYAKWDLEVSTSILKNRKKLLILLALAVPILAGCMQPTAPFCLWNSNYHAVLSDALNTGANIHLECCLALGGTLSRVAVEGQLREVNGREAELAVRTIKVMHLPTKAEDDDCNFYFGIRRQTEGDAAEHLGFYGKAHILATIMGPSGELSSLRLRFSRNFSVRQLRTCQRIP